MSVPAWVNGCLDYLAWTIFLTVNGFYALALGSGTAGLVWFVTTIVLIRSKTRGTRENWTSTYAWTVTLLVGTGLALLGNQIPMALILGTSAIWSYLPSLIEAWRSPSISGISPTTWWFALTEGIAYGIAGWGNLAAMVYGALTLALASGVLLRIRLGERSNEN